ncbi:MAG: single-stranded DNA-binding protein [Planctomycetes bacterium]|nr:single-stranded DNA-binding protein [Planctomycetota bacterium]
MANYNKVMLMGRLTRDPELRYTKGGKAVAEFSLAINSTFKTREGEKREEATFIDITVWERQAETCAEYLSKGRPVFVEGRLELDKWESKEGEKRSKLKVVATHVQFLGGPGGAKAGAGAGAAPKAEGVAETATGEPSEEDIPF